MNTPHKHAVRFRMLVSFALSLSLAFISSAAAATPTFPGVIRQQLGGSADPSCQVCHSGPTRIGTVTRSFGLAMRERGLQLYNEASLKSALDKMRSDAVDSDGDGTIDVEALKAGKDPNGDGKTASIGDQTPKPEYGCVGSVAPAEPGSLLSILLALGFVAARRKRHEP
jgi:hypothetical protein